MSFSNETILQVDLKKFKDNFNYLKSKLNSNTKIIGVVKAFAYGHGDIEISKKLESLGVYALWVSDFEEGVVLRKNGINCKIIVANPGLKSYNEIIKYKLDIIIYNFKLLDIYSSKKNNVNIHIKFNTGMNRYGFSKKDSQKIISKIKKHKHLKINSICSHLATSSRKHDMKFAFIQIKNFKFISDQFECLLKKKVIKHILNTNGVLNFPNQQMDCVRFGIGLYGSTDDSNLKQVSSLSSVVSQIRTVNAGEIIGYGASHICSQKTKVAIIPVGYADGVNRQFGNSVGSVVINNNKCPIVGEISMDSFVVDVTNISVHEGDLVEIFGNQLTVLEIIEKLKLIPYEVYSNLNRRIKRVYSD